MKDLDAILVLFFFQLLSNLEQLLNTLFPQVFHGGKQTPLGTENSLSRAQNNPSVVVKQHEGKKENNKSMEVLSKLRIPGLEVLTFNNIKIQVHNSSA